MRHKGSVSQINLERDKMIHVLFKKAKSLVQWPTNLMHICEVVAALPAPVFYISSDTAIVYIRRRYYYNDQSPLQSKHKQLLYDALFDKFIELKNNPENRNRSIPGLVMMALKSPAPCIGITPRVIYEIILKHKKLTRHSKHQKK